MSAIQRLLRGVWQGTKLVRMKILLYILAVCMVGVIIPNAFAEITITDDATGGGCTTIGTWDSASKTCTLTSDVSEQITIGSDGITLDGNSHTITMTTTAINNSAYHNNITVKNFRLYHQPI